MALAMEPSLEQLLASPDRYLHSFEGENALFVAMDRPAYRRSIFLDRRIEVAAPGGWHVPVGALAAAAPAPLATGWIFHMAHCGSTLLARALEELGGMLVLREPVALRQLGLAPDDALLGPALALLARRYDPGLPTLIKANVPVNFLLPEIAARQSGARAVLLWLGLEDYLCAILRSDMHRSWLRRVTELLAPRLGDLAGESDAVRAAALWLAQVEQFTAALTAMPQARTLDAEHFFARPHAALAAVAGHFGLTCPDQAIVELVASPLFATYSKRPEQAFSNADRLAIRAQTEATLGAELVEARAWLVGQDADCARLLADMAGKALTPP